MTASIIILAIVYGALIAVMVDAWMFERRNDDYDQREYQED